MKKVLIFLIAAWFIPCFTHAQISKLMSGYQGQNGVTITHLDKNLYGLYKKKKLSKEAEDLLKELKEVNILTFDLSNRTTPRWDPHSILDKMVNEILSQNYTLVKNKSFSNGKQLIYSKSEADKLDGLIVIDQKNDQQLNLIELRGNIPLENIALLSKALNINVLNSLSDLSSENENYAQYMRSFDYDNMADLSREMRKITREMQKNFRDFSWRENKTDSGITSGFDFGNIESMFDSLGMNFDHMGNFFDQLEERYGPALQGYETIANSIQITEENGKTKIKINTQNSDMIYIVDGIQFEGDEVTMPENIKNVYVVNDKNNPRKSYLIVISNSKLGEFISLKDNLLRFKYDNQEYKYNLSKSDKPLLWIDGRLSSSLSETDASRILQIRPVTAIEKEVGNYKGAEIFITTD